MINDVGLCRIRCSRTRSRRTMQSPGYLSFWLCRLDRPLSSYVWPHWRPVRIIGSTTGWKIGENNIMDSYVACYSEYNSTTGCAAVYLVFCTVFRSLSICSTYSLRRSLSHFYFSCLFCNIAVSWTTTYILNIYVIIILSLPSSLDVILLSL